MSLLRQLAHLQEQLGEACFQALISSHNTGKVKAFAETLLPQFCQRLAGELIPKHEGKPWEVVEDVEPTFVEGCQLDFPSFLEAGESLVKGEVMRSRAKGKNAVPGLVDAKFVLAHHHLIPEEMRGKYLVFAGSVLRDPDGYLCVPVLFWVGDCWVLDFRWLGGDFSGGGRLVARK